MQCGAEVGFGIRLGIGTNTGFGKLRATWKEARTRCQAMLENAKLRGTGTKKHPRQ